MDRKEMLTKRIKEYCFNNRLLEKGDRIVVGVSGGADSVFLLYFLCLIKQEIDFELLAVHVNHGIRGEEAEEDQRYVEMLTKQWKVELKTFYGNIPEMAKLEGMTEEEAGRKFRYECFETVCREKHFTKIAVAHHMDDQAETVLFQMVRGSSLRGLGGMRSRRGKIIRPLLCVERWEIEKFLKEKNLSYQTDSTNLSTEYARNKLRLQVIPFLKEQIQPAVVKHISAVANDMQEIGEYIDGQTKEWYDKTVIVKNNRWIISIETFCQIPVVIQRELLLRIVEECCGKRKDITRQHIESLRNLLFGETGKRIELPYQMKAGKDYGEVWIALENELDWKKSERVSVSRDAAITLPDRGCGGGKISVRRFLKKKELLSDSIPKNNCTKWIDYDKINFMLTFRHPQQGDYFMIGAQKVMKKKLSRFLIDQKLPLEQREALWVLADGNHIVWIPKYNRTSISYYVDDATEKVMEFFQEPLSEQQ